MSEELEKIKEQYIESWVYISFHFLSALARQNELKPCLTDLAEILATRVMLQTMYEECKKAKLLKMYDELKEVGRIINTDPDKIKRFAENVTLSYKKQILKILDK